jgi:hypothetical protein
VGLVDVLYVVYLCGGIRRFGCLSISKSWLRVYGLLKLCWRSVEFGMEGWIDSLLKVLVDH